jgi:hypothetical protein
MIMVMSSQGMVLVPLLVVHGPSITSMEREPCRGSLGLPVLPEGSMCPSGEAETCHEGSGAFDDAVGLGRGGEISPKTSIVPEASPQGSGEIEFVVCTLSG